jgi:hypothetical protein
MVAIKQPGFDRSWQSTELKPILLLANSKMKPCKRTIWTTEQATLITGVPTNSVPDRGVENVVR